MFEYANFHSWQEWFDASGGYHLMGHPNMTQMYDPDHCPWCAEHTQEEADIRLTYSVMS